MADVHIYTIAEFISLVNGDYGTDSIVAYIENDLDFNDSEEVNYNGYNGATFSSLEIQGQNHIIKNLYYSLKSNTIWQLFKGTVSVYDCAFSNMYVENNGYIGLGSGNYSFNSAYTGYFKTNYSYIINGEYDHCFFGAILISIAQNIFSTSKFYYCGFDLDITDIRTDETTVYFYPVSNYTRCIYYILKIQSQREWDFGTEGNYGSRSYIYFKPESTIKNFTQYDYGPSSHIYPQGYQIYVSGDLSQSLVEAYNNEYVFKQVSEQELHQAVSLYFYLDNMDMTGQDYIYGNLDSLTTQKDFISYHLHLQVPCKIKQIKFKAIAWYSWAIGRDVILYNGNNKIILGSLTNNLIEYTWNGNEILQAGSHGIFVTDLDTEGVSGIGTVKDETKMYYDNYMYLYNDYNTGIEITLEPLESGIWHLDNTNYSFPYIAPNVKAPIQRAYASFILDSNRQLTRCQLYQIQEDNLERLQINKMDSPLETT